VGAAPERRRREKPEKPLDQRAPTGIVDVAQIISNPTGASEVPFQLPMRGRMGKIRQSGIHLPEKLAEAAQQLRCVRIYFGEDRSGNIRK